MRWQKRLAGTAAAACCLAAAAPAMASFHLMQVEQIIGGVGGDTDAQAIQLRMRSAGQGVLIQGKIRVWDAAGTNPILITDFSTCPAAPTTCVPNQSGGSRVLIASASFASHTTPAAAPNFTMVNQIPASYLAAGSMTFEADSGGTIYWRISWGGAGYTGPGTVNIANDADGNANPPFGSAMPSGGVQALKFNGAFSAMSTNNANDYSITPAAATFTNNANAGFVVTLPPPPTGACCVGTTCNANMTQAACTGAGGTYKGDGSACDASTCAPPCPSDVNTSGETDIDDLFLVINNWGGTTGPADIDHSGLIDIDDLFLVINNWGPCD